MRRRTYSCLAIARRHGRLFARMTEPTHREHVTEVFGGIVRWVTWPNVRPRAVPAREQRSGPRSSRFADLDNA